MTQLAQVQARFVRPVRPTPHAGANNPVVVQLASLDIAPIGLSGLRCMEQHFFPRTVAWTYGRRYCETCCLPQDPEYAAVIETSLPFVQQEAACLSGTWWHASSERRLSHDLEPGAQYQPTHVGTRDAAEQLANKLRTDDPKSPVYLHRVGVTAQAVDPEIVIENQRADVMHTVLHGRVHPGAVVRYLNLREDAGSISLVGPRNTFSYTYTGRIR